MITTWRILIADDHALLRDAIRKLIESEPGMEVVGEASDIGHVIESAKTLQPDIVLLDLAMPGGSGLDAVEPIMEYAPAARIIVLTASISREQVVKAMQAGVRGIALKECTSDDLIHGIRFVMEGRYWVAGDCMNSLIEAIRDEASLDAPARKSKDFGLTRRELEIVSLVVAGYSNPEIARKCAISEQTVKHHMSNIFDKVGMYNRVELALFAVSHAIVGNS